MNRDTGYDESRTDNGVPKAWDTTPLSTVGTVNRQMEYDVGFMNMASYEQSVGHKADSPINMESFHNQPVVGPGLDPEFVTGAVGESTMQTALVT